MNWEKIYDDAKEFAAHAHSLQSYDNEPYTVHLNNVESILKKFGFELGQSEMDSVLICSAHLHDILEDCGFSASYNDLKKRFGFRIADCVYGVTDDTGKNRDERKNFERIRSHRYSITLKLADRIANIEHSLKKGHRMSDMYKKEYAKFRFELLDRAVSILDERTQAMWDHLDLLFEE